ncbi:MAG: hypothetical protein ACE5JB_14250 [bacterium]
MKKIEITLEDELHNKLDETSRKTSKSIEQLIHELLNRSLKELESTPTFAENLLAEGYQVMAKENAKIVDESLVAQIMALENQSESYNDPDS